MSYYHKVEVMVVDDYKGAETIAIDCIHYSTQVVEVMTIDEFEGTEVVTNGIRAVDPRQRGGDAEQQTERDSIINQIAALVDDIRWYLSTPTRFEQIYGNMGKEVITEDKDSDSEVYQETVEKETGVDRNFLEVQTHEELKKDAAERYEHHVFEKTPDPKMKSEEIEFEHTKDMDAIEARTKEDFGVDKYFSASQTQQKSDPELSKMNEYHVFEEMVDPEMKKHVVNSFYSSNLHPVLKLPKVKIKGFEFRNDWGFYYANKPFKLKRLYPPMPTKDKKEKPPDLRQAVYVLLQPQKRELIVDALIRGSKSDMPHNASIKVIKSLTDAEMKHSKSLIKSAPIENANVVSVCYTVFEPIVVDDVVSLLDPEICNSVDQKDLEFFNRACGIESDGCGEIGWKNYGINWNFDPGIDTILDVSNINHFSQERSLGILAYEKFDGAENALLNDEFIKAKTSFGSDRRKNLEQVSNVMENVLIFVGVFYLKSSRICFYLRCGLKLGNGLKATSRIFLKLFKMKCDMVQTKLTRIFICSGFLLTAIVQLEEVDLDCDVPIDKLDYMYKRSGSKMEERYELLDQFRYMGNHVERFDYYVTSLSKELWRKSNTVKDQLLDIKLLEEFVSYISLKVLDLSFEVMFEENDYLNFHGCNGVCNQGGTMMQYHERKYTHYAMLVESIEVKVVTLVSCLNIYMLLVVNEELWCMAWIGVVFQMWNCSCQCSFLCHR